MQSKIITSGSQLTNQLVKTQQKSSTSHCFYGDGTEVNLLTLNIFQLLTACVWQQVVICIKNCAFLHFFHSPMFVNQLIDCRVTEQAGNRLFLLLTFESAVGGCTRQRMIRTLLTSLIYSTRGWEGADRGEEGGR